MESAKNSHSPGFWRKTKSLNLDNLRIIYEQSDVLRIKVVVSKKVAAKAVDRNRIKRIIRHAIEPRQKGSFVFIVKKNIRELKTQDMSIILRDFFKKI